MIRDILAVIVGVVVAAAIATGAEFLFRALTPATAALPAAPSREALAAYAADQPAGAVKVVLAGWFVALFAGAWIAVKTGRGGRGPGWVVTSTFLVGAVANAVLVPHPLWVTAGALVLIAVGGWLGTALAVRRSGAAP